MEAKQAQDLGRVLVTGATGFIGYAVARKLAQRGLRPRLMVRRPARGRLLSHLDAELVYGNLLRPESLARVVEGVDTIFHLAARATFERYNRLRPTIVGGSTELMKAATRAGVKRFVFASSLLVYGSTDGEIDASTPARPQIGYGIAKVEAEESLRRQASAGMELAILRLPHVYGARSFLFDQLKNGFLLFPGSGENVYSHLHVEDAADLLVEVAARGWTGTSPVADHDPSTWNGFFGVLDKFYPAMRLLQIPAALAIAGASVLEAGLSRRKSPTLFTADTVRGWLLNLPVRRGLVWQELGLEPRYPSINVGIPASLDETVAFRWLHSTVDRSSG
jgi:nucleoside-diphosphate-sugar epimerase